MSLTALSKDEEQRRMSPQGPEADSDWLALPWSLCAKLLSFLSSLRLSVLTRLSRPHCDFFSNDDQWREEKEKEDIKRDMEGKSL